MDSHIEARHAAAARHSFFRMNPGVIHGAQDQLVPCSMGQVLSEKAAKDVEFIKIAKASHNDVCIEGP